MEISKLIELLKRIPNQNIDVGQIYISAGGTPMVVLLDGRSIMITDRGLIIHDPKYRPRS